MDKTFNNLCNSCTNTGCEFQSGIVRTECAFYIPPQLEPDNCGNYVVIPKAEYETRLKADMVAMLTEIQTEIEELYPKARKTYRDGLTSYCEGVDDSREIIQQKIDKLKEAKDGPAEN